MKQVSDGRVLCLCGAIHVSSEVIDQKSHSPPFQAQSGDCEPFLNHYYPSIRPECSMLLSCLGRSWSWSKLVVLSLFLGLVISQQVPLALPAGILAQRAIANHTSTPTVQAPQTASLAPSISPMLVHDSNYICVEHSLIYVVNTTLTPRFCWYPISVRKCFRVIHREASHQVL